MKSDPVLAPLFQRIVGTGDCQFVVSDLMATYLGRCLEARHEAIFEAIRRCRSAGAFEEGKGIVDATSGVRLYAPATGRPHFHVLAFGKGETWFVVGFRMASAPDAKIDAVMAEALGMSLMDYAERREKMTDVIGEVRVSLCRRDGISRSMAALIGEAYDKDQIVKTAVDEEATPDSLEPLREIGPNFDRADEFFATLRQALRPVDLVEEADDGGKLFRGEYRNIHTDMDDYGAVQPAAHRLCILTGYEYGPVAKDLLVELQSTIIARRAPQIVGSFGKIADFCVANGHVDRAKAYASNDGDDSTFVQVTEDGRRALELRDQHGVYLIEELSHQKDAPKLYICSAASLSGDGTMRELTRFLMQKDAFRLLSAPSFSVESMRTWNMLSDMVAGVECAIEEEAPAPHETVRPSVKASFRP